MTDKPAHITVLLTEAVDALVTSPSGVYVDGTFGRGGHSREILKRLDAQGRLLVIDKDPEAIAHAKDLFGEDSRVIICQGSFAQLAELVGQHGLEKKVTGVLLDLGVSSPQLDDAQRGFSFMRDGPLDMRMNTTQGLDAATWLTEVSEAELIRVLREFGEERFAKRIARAILAAVKAGPVTRTLQLAEIVSQANPSREKKHPATRTFQALRIAVNNELGDLQACLEQSLQVLEKSGRLAVISFHSLEDQIVKRFFRREAQGAQLPAGLPLTEEELAKYKSLKIVGKAVRPTDTEVDDNVRSRSAILRVAEKR